MIRLPLVCKDCKISHRVLIRLYDIFKNGDHEQCSYGTLLTVDHLPFQMVIEKRAMVNNVQNLRIEQPGIYQLIFGIKYPDEVNSLRSILWTILLCGDETAFYDDWALAILVAK